MPSRPAPGSLHEARSAPAGAERVKALMAYIDRAEKAAADGRRERDVEVRRMCLEQGPTKTAADTGLTLGTVKAANKPANDPPPGHGDAP